MIKHKDVDEAVYQALVKNGLQVRGQMLPKQEQPSIEITSQSIILNPSRKIPGRLSILKGVLKAQNRRKTDVDMIMSGSFDDLRIAHEQVDCKTPVKGITFKRRSLKKVKR